MGKNNIKKIRSRKFCILLYPENKRHNDAIEYIKSHYSYALILHNKDVNNNGELKKEHYHVIINFNNAKWNSAVAEELNIELNLIQKCNNFENALEYLIHYNDPEKYQYNFNDVKGDLKPKLNQLLIRNSTTEDDRIQIMFDYINEMDLPISIRAFSEFCHIAGVWGDFRRNSSIFFKLIDEHNNKIIKKGGKL